MNELQKINQAKIELTSIIDKGGKLSIYHVGHVLRAIGDSLQAVPWAIAKDADYAREELEKFIEYVVRISKTILDGYDKFDDSMMDIYDKHQNMYKKVEKAHERIAAKIESLPPLPDINIPYNIDKLIEIAERFKDLDNETWQRVVDLAFAFGKKRT